MKSLRLLAIGAFCGAVLPLAGRDSFGATIVSQPPIAGGGVMRWSQLWQDPGPNGNDLDGDSICWEDFSTAYPVVINHLEWWGNGASELGFRIDFWKQDPGTIAYQPWAVFEAPGSAVQPEARFTAAPGDYVEVPEAGGLTHYTLDLQTAVSLPANTAGNPRWFIAVIGLTQKAYYNWNWAQNSAGSSRTFQFIRGGTAGGGSLFRQLPEGRAFVLAGTIAEPPRLRMTLLSPTEAQIAWTTNSVGFVLKTAGAVPSMNWSNVVNAVNVVGEEYVVTTPIGATSAFFQLQKN